MRIDKQYSSMKSLQCKNKKQKLKKIRSEISKFNIALAEMIMHNHQINNQTEVFRLKREAHFHRST